MSLFLISDVLLILPFADDRYGSAAFALGVISCLSPGLFWPKRIFLGWVCVLAIAIAVFFIVDSLVADASEAKAALAYAFTAIYAFVPLALWWRYGILPRRLDADRWIMIRRGLIGFYLPALVGNLWFFVIAWREGVWGFVPCWLGIHLMALGYMRLSRGASLEGASASRYQSDPD